jgi:N-acetyl-gamma-glutamyl-phosphate reductase
MVDKIKVSIVGAPGYVATELLRLLGRRKDIEIVEVVGRSAAGQPLGKVVPSLAPLGLTVKGELENPGAADFVFLSLHAGESARLTAEILERTEHTKIIDMSADFRLRDLEAYEKWYGGRHPAPYLMPGVVYGLPELYRSVYKSSTRIVANPGCYPTCSSLALAPALKSKIVEPHVVINALSGTSGAGRGLKQNLHFAEMHDSSSAYGLDGHRHNVEIEQILSDVHGSPVVAMFVPHLIPVSRGMLATCSAPLKDLWIMENKDPKAAVREMYKQFYAEDEFVRVVDTPPTTKEVFGSNYCYIYPTVDLNSYRLLVVSVLDNLVKGAAGEAVQSMNILAGLPEATGLDGLGLYP